MDECLPYIDAALERLAYCFAKINDKYLPAGKEPFFNHLHTDQYAMFLYLVANCASTEGDNKDLADRVYALNKSLHAIDVYHEVELPRIFFFQHPVGTVLGRASYSDYFVVYQRCTVGGKDGVYPELGEGFVMFGDCGIIGQCKTGNNVWLSAGTRIMSEDIEEHSVVFGATPRLTVKQTKRDVRQHFFTG